MQPNQPSNNQDAPRIQLHKLKDGCDIYLIGAGLHFRVDEASGQLFINLVVQAGKTSPIQGLIIKTIALRDIGSFPIDQMVAGLTKAFEDEKPLIVGAPNG